MWAESLQRTGCRAAPQSCRPLVVRALYNLPLGPGRHTGGAGALGDGRHRHVSKLRLSVQQWLETVSPSLDHPYDAHPLGDDNRVRLLVRKLPV